MTITHVSTVAATSVPGSVAVGDLVLLTTSASWGRATSLRDDLLGKGWLQMYGTGDRVGTTGMVVSHWWRRWTADAPTSLPTYTAGDVAVVSIWRGAGPAGIRDAAFSASTTSSAPVAPGVAAKAGDVAVVSFATGGPVTGVSPAPTQRVNVSAGAYNGKLYVGTDARAADGTTPPYMATVGPTNGGSLAGVVVVSEPTAPLAPTLEAPAPSQVVDLAAGGTFTWAHKRAGFGGSASGAQEAYALRRRVGVGAYQYWNAGTASWSATIAWNASVDGSVTFPAGAWTNETQYAWSVATKEDAGHNAGPFAPDRTLFARTKPAVSITAPDPVVSTPQPTITWTATFTSPWAPIAYEVSVFEKATADTAGFDPETIAPVWTSGQYASTGTSVVPSVPLVNGTAYAVFVRVQQTGGQWSDWQRVDTLVSLAAPAAPHVDAVAATDPASGCPVVTVTVSARDNLLTAADASIEVTSTWAAGANTTVAEVTEWAADGTHSLKLTATAAGDVSVSLPDPVPVTAGGQYTGQAVVHAATRVTRSNLVHNPSFEADTTGWQSSGSTITRDLTEHFVGSAALKVVTIGGGSYGASTPLSGVEASEGDVVVSAWLKAAAGTSLTLRADEYTAASAYVGSGSANITASGSWQRVSASRSGVAAGNIVRPMILTPTATTFWVDAVMVEKAAVMGSYFDGDTTDVGDSVCAWTGAPNASASTLTEPPRDVTTTLLWEDDGGLSLGSTPSTATPDSAGTDGAVISVTGTAPPNAAGARLQVLVAGCTAGEVHYADKFGISPGADTPWSPGGFADTTATVEYSDDPLSGVWGTLATATLDRAVTFTDWTPQPGQLRAYRARTSAGAYSSPPSEVALAGIDTTDYWLVDVEAGSALAIRLRTDEQRTYPRERGEFEAFGRAVSAVRYGDERTVRGAYTALTWSAAEMDALVDVLNSGHTLLVQGPREEGVYPRHLYMAVVDDPTTERLVQGPFAYRVISWSWRADLPPLGEGYGGLYPAGYTGTL